MPETAPMEMSATYMRYVFGMTVEEVIIEGHNAMPGQAEQIIAQGLEKVVEVAKTLTAQPATV